MYIGNVSGNASSVLKSGDVVTFDVILLYLDSSAKGYKEVTDDGTVTSIELSEGLVLESFGKVKVVSSLDLRGYLRGGNVERRALRPQSVLWQL